MRPEVKWYDNEKTIIIQKFPETWTWEDFYEAVQETVEMEKTVSHPVYIVGTQPPKGQTPKGNVLANYNTAIKMHPDHMRFYILATDNYFTSVFGNIFLKTTPLRTKVRMVNTFEDALEFIAKDKAQLPEFA